MAVFDKFGKRTGLKKDFVRKIGTRNGAFDGAVEGRDTFISRSERSFTMIYSHEVESMCKVAQGVNHGAAPIPEEAKWVQAKEVKDISGLTTWHWLVCSAAGCL